MKSLLSFTVSAFNQRYSLWTRKSVLGQLLGLNVVTNIVERLSVCRRHLRGTVRPAGRYGQTRSGGS
jgi:hypothetical protein